MSSSSEGSHSHKVETAKKAVHTAWVVTKVGGKGLRTGAKAVKTGTGHAKNGTAWLMARTLGPHKYRRDVDDVSGRLSDALQRIEASLRARDEEIRRLRAELGRMSQGEP